MSNIHDVERDTIRVAEAGESTGKVEGASAYTSVFHS